MSAAIEGAFEDLIDWLNGHSIPFGVRDPGGVRRVAINGQLTVLFGTTLPRIVVEWGDGYRGDFSHGLPSAALTGLIGGFLGIAVAGNAPLEPIRAIHHGEYIDARDNIPRRSEEGDSGA